MYYSLTDSLVRWIQAWDIELKLQHRQIALTLDNFSGHKIKYQPKCITFIYFEPGLTSHIQPLDAGIIHSFKAHYQRLFCLHAIWQDDIEEQDIYKTNLLEAMRMAERAWKSVSLTTIKNCWNHTKIQRPRLPIIMLRPPRPPMPANLAAGCNKTSPTYTFFLTITTFSLLYQSFCIPYCFPLLSHDIGSCQPRSYSCDTNSIDPLLLFPLHDQLLTSLFITLLLFPTP